MLVRDERNVVSDDRVRAAPRYSTESRKKTTGASYTPARLAEFVALELARLARFNPDGEIRVCDPAVGDGELLVHLVQELQRRGHRKISVRGFDKDADALRLAEGRIRSIALPGISEIEFVEGDFLEHICRSRVDGRQPDLFSGVPKAAVDLVVANPPYVRTQVLGANAAQLLARTFKLTGRVDLYQAFVLAITSLLKAGGLLGIIVSNRFMSTRAGGAVRQCFIENYCLKQVWDLGDTRLFPDAVLPAVVIAERSDEINANVAVPFVRSYSTESVQLGAPFENILDGLAHGASGMVQVDGKSFEITRGLLNHGSSTHGVWRVTTQSTDDWLTTVEANKYCNFRDIGKIHVGIKTTADNVFVRQNWNSLPSESRPEPEVLHRLITHKQTRRWRISSESEQLEMLYPHTTNDGVRSPIVLEHFPRTARYLANHRTQLEGRTYVIAARRQWYEIWVPHDPMAWKKPKLVFRDIAQSGEFLMDLDQRLVNGDCYWMMASTQDKEDLLWLAMAVGNSAFGGEFYDHKFHNKLYAGRRRFMSQYVEQFPLPDPCSPEGVKLIALTKRLYESIDNGRHGSVIAMEREVDRLVYQAFGVSQKIAG